MPRFLDLDFDQSNEWGAICADEIKTRRVKKAPPLRREMDLPEGLISPVADDNKAKPVYECVLYLASRCDHALAHDGEGFNRLDADIGHNFAKTIRKYGRLYSARQFDVAKRLCRKYRGQLIAAGHDIDVVMTCLYDARPPSPNMPTVPISGQVLVIGEKAVKVAQNDGALNWWPRSQMIRLRVAAIGVEGGNLTTVSDIKEGDQIEFDGPKWLAKKKGVATD